MSNIILISTNQIYSFGKCLWKSGKSYSAENISNSGIWFNCFDNYVRKNLFIILFYSSFLRVNSRMNNRILFGRSGFKINAPKWRKYKRKRDRTTKRPRIWKMMKRNWTSRKRNKVSNTFVVINKSVLISFWLTFVFCYFFTRWSHLLFVSE